MITENIVSAKLVTSNGVEKFIVHTKSGAEIWVNKSQFDEKAETISYNAHKKGSKYTNREGVEAERKTDSNEFVGCGKMSKTDLLDYLISRGVTPSFNM